MFFFLPRGLMIGLDLHLIIALLLHRHESEFIQHIVEVVLLKLSSSFPSITNDLVGIDSAVEELINSYLGLQNNVA